MLPESGLDCRQMEVMNNSEQYLTTWDQQKYLQELLSILHPFKNMRLSVLLQIVIFLEIYSK